jgi:hypothetical protein
MPAKGRAKTLKNLTFYPPLSQLTIFAGLSAGVNRDAVDAGVSMVAARGAAS